MNRNSCLENAIVFSIGITCGQGARKSASTIALSRAPLALTVSTDLSASDGEQDEIRVGKRGREPLPERIWWVTKQKCT